MKDINQFINESLKKREVSWNGLELIEYKDRNFNDYFNVDINTLKMTLKEIAQKEKDNMPKYTFLRGDYEDHGVIRLIVKYEDKDKMKEILNKHKTEFPGYNEIKSLFKFDDPIEDGINSNKFCYWDFT